MSGDAFGAGTISGVSIQLYAFVWGAVWGSFLNVVIYRLPAGASLSSPGSRCGACLTPIRWYDNIPIVSYLVLRGRCRACRASYSPRYMLVEAACGVLSLWLFQQTALPPLLDVLAAAEVGGSLGDDGAWVVGLLTWLWLQAFVYALIAITFIDLEHTYIPDEISLPLIALGIFGSMALPDRDPLAGLIGAAAGAGFVVAMALLGFILFRREAIGLGDAKLLALIGAFIGWRALPFVVFASAAQALIAYALARLYVGVTGKRDALTLTTAELDERFGEVGRFPESRAHAVLPYGPFLALAALEALLFGDGLLWALTEGLAELIVGPPL